MTTERFKDLLEYKAGPGRTPHTLAADIIILLRQAENRFRSLPREHNDKLYEVRNMLMSIADTRYLAYSLQVDLPYRLAQVIEAIEILQLAYACKYPGHPLTTAIHYLTLYKISLAHDLNLKEKHKCNN